MPSTLELTSFGFEESDWGVKPASPSSAGPVEERWIQAPLARFIVLTAPAHSVRLGGHYAYAYAEAEVSGASAIWDEMAAWRAAAGEMLRRIDDQASSPEE